MKKSLKKLLVEHAKKTAERSVGRSIPRSVHEPKMPKALKQDR